MSGSKMTFSTSPIRLLIGLGLAVMSVHGIMMLDEQQPHQRCGLVHGTVCVPTVCSVTKCALFGWALCVNDKCGCEARFFSYLTKDKLVRDVTKICTTSNAIFNFSRFTYDEDGAVRYAESQEALQVLRQFNQLVVELLSEITVYLKNATETTPTEANIHRLKKAINTLAAIGPTARYGTRHFLDQDSGHSEMYYAIEGFKHDAEILAEILVDNGTDSSVFKKGGNAVILDGNVLKKLTELKRTSVNAVNTRLKASISSGEQIR